MSRFTSSFGVIMAALLVQACTHHYEVSNEPVVEPVSRLSNAGVPLDIGILIERQFASAEWRRERLGDEFIIAIGPALRANSIAVARDVFNGVSIMDGLPSPPYAAPILEPSLIDIDRSMGAWAGADQLVTIALQWRLVDRCDDTVWLESVKGEGRAATGNILTHKATTREAIEKALRNVFTRSRSVMMGAPELADFADSAERGLMAASC